MKTETTTVKAFEPLRGDRPLLVLFNEHGRIAGWASARRMNQWSYRDIGTISRHIATASELPVPTDLVPKSDKVVHMSNRGGNY